MVRAIYTFSKVYITSEPLPRFDGKYRLEGKFTNCSHDGVSESSLGPVDGFLDEISWHVSKYFGKGKERDSCIFTTIPAPITSLGENAKMYVPLTDIELGVVRRDILDRIKTDKDLESKVRRH